MSFLTKTIPRGLAATLPRASITPARTFTTSFPLQKILPDAVKDTLKKADRAVSDNIIIPAVDATGIFPSLLLLFSPHINTR